jgi:biotin operon repressor
VLCAKIKQGFLHMLTATKHIFKTTPSNFTIIANDLINSSMPSVPFRVHTYLLSKPADWQPKIHDIRKQLGLSTYAVKKALKWLLKAGFAVYKRLKTGHTVWDIFDKPQTRPQAKITCKPVFTPQVEIPQVAFQPDLTITETETKKQPRRYR